MPIFVHVTSEAVAKKARRSGIRAASIYRPPMRGVFAMPVIPNFQVSHQWVREMKRWRHGLVVGIYFRIPDSEPVLVGRYNEQPQEMTAAQAAAHVMSQTAMTGVQVIIPRGVLPAEIIRVRGLPQLVGWRHYPDAHCKRPWSCECCQKGQYGSKKIREKYAVAVG